MKTFVEAVLPISTEDLVFLDETGSHLNMTRTHARAPSGQRAVCEEARQPGRNLTLLGALTTQGMIFLQAIQGGTTREVFQEFAMRLVGWLRPGQVVVLDNLRAHHTQEVREVFTKAGIRMLFLPPYSPTLNPIELAWSKIKLGLRSAKARTVECLWEAAQEMQRLISPLDVEGWYGHCGYL